MALAATGRAVMKMLDPALTWMSTRYRAAVGDNLRKHGLRYEDLYDPLLNQARARGSVPLRSCLAACMRWPRERSLTRPARRGQDVDEALKRLPQEEVDARNQRLKRASDVSLKKAYLPKDLQAVQTPFKSYMAVRPAGPRGLRVGPLVRGAALSGAGGRAAAGHAGARRR
jgi:ubiquinol-cytochrome c reductase subunit 7